MEDEIFQFTTSIKGIAEATDLEKIDRINNTQNKFTTGNSYFDDALCGLYSNDVLLIGAKSGKGKTQFAVELSEINARQGRRVLYFALEAEKYEITRRIKFKYISEYYYKNRSKYPDMKYIRYAEWYYGQYGSILNDAEDFAKEKLNEIGDHLKVVYRDAGKYTVDDFAKMFFSMQKEFDIFVVDHIHYFDSDEENENKALKEIMKRIRDCALVGERLVVLVAHLRKSDRGSKNLMPDLEDFHGSSDLGKIATKAIVMVPSKDESHYDPKNKNRFPTLLKVLKSRVGSDVERYTSLGFFDISRNGYEQFYSVGEAPFDKWSACEQEHVPHWCRRKVYKNEFGEIVSFEK